MTTRTIAGVKWRRTALDCWDGAVGPVHLCVMGKRGRYVLDAERAIRVDDLQFTGDGGLVGLTNRERFSGNLAAAMTCCAELAEGIGLGMLERAVEKLEVEKHGK